MSMFAYALAFLPSAAALTVAAFAIADTREGAALNRLRELSVREPEEQDDARQSPAA